MKKEEMHPVIKAIMESYEMHPEFKKGARPHFDVPYVLHVDLLPEPVYACVPINDADNFGFILDKYGIEHEFIDPLLDDRNYDGTGLVDGIKTEDGILNGIPIYSRVSQEDILRICKDLHGRAPDEVAPMEEWYALYPYMSPEFQDEYNRLHINDPD